MTKAEILISPERARCSDGFISIFRPQLSRHACPGKFIPVTVRGRGPGWSQRVRRAQMLCGLILSGDFFRPVRAARTVTSPELCAQNQLLAVTAPVGEGGVPASLHPSPPSPPLGHWLSVGKVAWGWNSGLSLFWEASVVTLQKQGP